MTTPPFNWNDLRFLLAVARSRTLSLAGRRTGTDHATVSRRISALAAALGLQLFARNPRGYHLPQHGEALIGTPTAIQAEAVRSEDTAAGNQPGRGRQVLSSTPERFAHFFHSSRIRAP